MASGLVSHQSYGHENERERLRIISCEMASEVGSPAVKREIPSPRENESECHQKASDKTIPEMGTPNVTMNVLSPRKVGDNNRYPENGCQGTELSDNATKCNLPLSRPNTPDNITIDIQTDLSSHYRPEDAAVHSPECDEITRSPDKSDCDPQTTYNTILSDIQITLARKHDQKEQFLGLLARVLLRLFATLLLSAAMVGCFKYYENISILSEAQKNIFNSLSTGIYLTMGLNLAGAFKGYATMLRWRLLARKPHNLLEVDLILGLSSLMKVFKLSLHSLKDGRFAAFFACISWIIVNCVGRVSVALTGLAYSYDSAGAIGSRLGTVNVADTRYFWPSADISEEIPTLGAQYQTAHLYGEFSSVMITDDEDDILPNEQQDIVWNNNTKKWTYHFKEYNPQHRHLFVASNRSISISTTCTKYHIVDGMDGSGETMTFYNHTAKHNVTWDVSDMGTGSTVYAVQSEQQNDTDIYTCPLGPRCAVVMGFQFLRRNNSAEPNAFFHEQEDVDSEHGSDLNLNPQFRRRRQNRKRTPTPLIHPEFELTDSDDKSEDPDDISWTNEGDGSADNSASLFECHVYVSQVHNAYLPQHQLPDRIAWIAAGSIGLDGFTDDDHHVWFFHQYHKGTMFGQRQNGDPNAIARLVGRFTAGAIGTMDIAGPKVNAFGHLAWQGILFKVDWDRTIGILFGICLMQMVLGFLCCSISNRVLVKDDSYLSTARLLRPTVERLGPSGCALTGREIARTLKTKMVYGVRFDKSGTRHHLDLGEDIAPLAGRGFPEGWYDGSIEGMRPYKEMMFREEEQVDAAIATMKVRMKNSKTSERQKKLKVD